MAVVKSYSRVRSSGGFSWLSSTWNSLDTDCNTPLFHNWTFNLCQIGHSRQTTDVVNPKFRERSKRGEVIITPYTHTRETQECSGDWSKIRFTTVSCPATGAKRGEDITGPYGCFNYAGGSRLAAVSLITDLEIKSAIEAAATQAWSKSNGNNAQVLTDLGEGRQTLAMFRRPFSSLQPLLRSINRSRKVQLAGRLVGGTAQTAASLWLQYRYGIRPLVKSVNDICKELKAVRSKKRQTYRGKYTLHRTASPSYTVGSWSTTCNVQEMQSDFIEIRTGILVEELVELSTSLGVDASGLLSTPWELVPFSFVADWFINVGSFLQALHPFFTKHPLGTWVVTRRLQKRSIQFSNTVPTPGSGVTIERGVTERRAAEHFTVQRVPWLPAPSLTLKPQALQQVFSDLRGLDTFALALQQLGRIFKA